MALDLGRGPVKRHCHITSLDIDIGSESSEITRIAAAGSSLLLGFSDGRVVLFEWSPSSRPAEAPLCRRAWQLQSSPSALAIRGATSAGFAGTQAGLLMFMEVEKDSASVLSTAHEGSTVSALLCGYAPGIGGAPQTSGVANVLFSADVGGRIFRCWLSASNTSETANLVAPKAELCADVRSPVLALQLCERTGRLLVSTTERIAIVDDVLKEGYLANPAEISAKMRWVGSKPHKGQLSAIFSPNFGLDALVAARPGGRLWVAEAATGTVQTTLKFQSGDDKAALCRLVALDSRTVASWTRSEENAGDGTATNATITLLDLEAIAVSHEWSIAPVVDLANCSGGCLLIAHRRAVTLLLVLESPEAVLRALLAGSGSRLLRDRAFFVGCLKEAQSLRQVSALYARDVLHCLHPLIEAVTSIEESTTGDGLDQDESSLTAKETISMFKGFVMELEDKEELEASEDDQLKLSLVVAPLANFPVAEGSGAAVNHSSVDGRLRAREAVVAEVEDAAWSFGSCVSVASNASIAGNGFMTPQLLSRCQQAASAGAEKLAVEPSLASDASVVLPPEPEAAGAVLMALGVTPFRSSPVVLRYFSEILQWLVVALDVTISQNSAGSVSSIASAAATAFELLCLYSVIGDGIESSSAWPMIGLVPVQEVDSSSKPKSECLAEELATHLRTLASVAAAAMEQGAQPKTEPWASCKEKWTAAVALAFCENLLCSASLPQIILDRCLLRANGLAAQGQEWPTVVRWLREKSAECSPQFQLPRSDTWDAWDAALLRAEDATRAPDPGSGANALHACLEAALGAAGRPNAVGRHLGADCAVRARKTFGVALATFPKVLPWNVAHWIQCALRASTSTGQAVPRALLITEFVQYLLRLLPTCARCSDIRSLLHVALTVALHSDLDILHERIVPNLIRGRNAVGDSLIGQYADQLTPALLSKLRYPLGTLLLLNGKEAVDISDEAFEKSVAAVVGILKEATEDDERRLANTRIPTPARAPPLPFQAAITRRREVSEEDYSETSLSYAEPSSQSPRETAGNCRRKRCYADRLQDDTPEQTLGYAQSSSSVSTTCITRGDLDLAHELKKLCARSDRRRRHLLDAMAKHLTKLMTASVDENSLPINIASGSQENSTRKLTPFERLLVAFAKIEPSAELASLAYSAVVGDVSSEHIAAAMALPLWKAARLDGVLFSGCVAAADSHADVATKTSDSAIFRIPPAVQPPQPPVPALPTQRQAKRISAVSLDSHHMNTGVDPDSSRCAGFHRTDDRYVEISSDGYCARHLDDSGEQMHGVVMSQEPLKLSGKIGYYFEVELVEVRPEEMPDGLTVGVTTTEPTAIQENPDTAEHIPNTWAVGYDGQLWDAKTGGLSRVDWDPRCLVPGDLIGVLVTLAEGELLVFHNGAACCPGPRGIPVDPGCALYAVVDLLGAARAVQWRPKAQPPIGS